jgi:hypothetical protein
MDEQTTIGVQAVRQTTPEVLEISGTNGGIIMAESCTLRPFGNLGIWPRCLSQTYESADPCTLRSPAQIH